MGTKITWRAVRTKIAAPHPQSFLSIGLEWALRISVFSIRDTETAGPGTKLWEPLVYRNITAGWVPWWEIEKSSGPWKVEPVMWDSLQTSLLRFWPKSKVQMNGNKSKGVWTIVVQLKLDFSVGKSRGLNCYQRSDVEGGHVCNLGELRHLALLVEHHHLCNTKIFWFPLWLHLECCLLNLVLGLFPKYKCSMV